MRRDRLRHIARYPLALMLALTAFVVGHNLYFLLQYGSEYTKDLARSGDGTSWDATVRVVLVAAILLTMVATLRLAYLLRHVRRFHPGQRGIGFSGSVYLRKLMPVWLGLFSASVPLFVGQENLERWSAGLALPGIGVIGTVGPVSPLAVFALVSLAFALVVALFRLSIERLEALIAEAQGRSSRRAPVTALPPKLDPESSPTSVIGCNLAGRAPPALVACPR